jgi:NAD(P)-dependent dehydrogenase (short-subunit alcohol dehydrogenase family)
MLSKYSEDDYMKQFKTNVFGPINVTRAFLPHFRSQRSGTIVNIGSMSAWETYPGVGAYSASKAALRCMFTSLLFRHLLQSLLRSDTDATEALAQELGSTGIKTLLVEPGQFRTELLGPSNSMFVETKIPEYQDAANASFGEFRSAHSTQRGDPVKGVARIIDVVKGEGEAAGREWSGELVLGPDAVGVIRKKCDGMLRLLSDWEGLSSSTDV